MPHLTRNYFLNFYGGEPLLAFDLIQRILSFLSQKNKEFRKKALYCLTTNGSLLTDETLHFLGKNKFMVELSFDGLAQEVHRKKGSFRKIEAHIQQILKHPDIKLEVNSVFTPETVDLLSESMEYLMDLGVARIHFSLSTLTPWTPQSLRTLNNQMVQLRKILLFYYQDNNGRIPVVNFQKAPKKGIFSCAAGKDRLAVSPEGKIWGCYLFPDYFRGKEKSTGYRKFFFGSLDDFMKDYGRIYPHICSNHTRLSMDNFSTPHMECLFCSELEECAICPINAAFAGSPIGKIPAYMCEIQKIKIKERKRLEKQIQQISSH